MEIEVIANIISFKRHENKAGIFCVKFESVEPFINAGFTIDQLKPQNDILCIKMAADCELKCGWARLKVLIANPYTITYIGDPDDYLMLEQRVLLLENEVKELSKKFDALMELRCIRDEVESVDGYEDW